MMNIILMNMMMTKRNQKKKKTQRVVQEKVIEDQEHFEKIKYRYLKNISTEILEERIKTRKEDEENIVKILEIKSEEFREKKVNEGLDIGEVEKLVQEKILLDKKAISSNPTSDSWVKLIYQVKADLLNPTTKIYKYLNDKENNLTNYVNFLGLKYKSIAVLRDRIGKKYNDIEFLSVVNKFYPEFDEVYWEKIKCHPFASHTSSQSEKDLDKGYINIKEELDIKKKKEYWNKENNDKKYGNKNEKGKGKYNPNK